MSVWSCLVVRVIIIYHQHFSNLTMSSDLFSAVLLVNLNNYFMGNCVIFVIRHLRMHGI